MEPEYYGEIAHIGIVNGDVDGAWLLSYWLPEDDTQVNVAVFDSREEALEMAAQIDAVRDGGLCWRLDTVFLNPSNASELLAMLNGE